MKIKETQRLGLIFFVCFGSFWHIFGGGLGVEVDGLGVICIRRGFLLDQGSPS